MKTLLVFREGHSGNFLKFLIESPQSLIVEFRMPERRIPNNFNITLTHLIDHESQKNLFDQVLRVLPTRKIYLAVYNNFMKKLVVEEPDLDFENWTDHPTRWYDKCYYNINEYHKLILDDIANNQYPDIIDFDHISDIQYLEYILKKYFNLQIDADREIIIKKYAGLQLQVDLDSDSKTMEDIVSPITDDMFETNPWFFSYCLHKYEKSNGFSDSDRKWSINDVSITQTRRDLLELSFLYDRSDTDSK